MREHEEGSMNHTITSRLRRVVGTMAQVKVPTSEISLGTVNGRRFLQFSHITWNSGTGPLEFRPSYNFQTGISQAIQALYTSNGNGTWTFATTVPIVKPMVFVAPDDY